MNQTTSAPPRLDSELTWLPPPPLARSRQREAVELAVGFGLILIVIWTPRPWQRMFYFIAASFIAACLITSYPGASALGLRTRNLVRSLWIIGVALIVAASTILVADHLQTLHAPGTVPLFFKRYAGYIIFAFVQQFLLQDFFLPRMLRIVRQPSCATLAAAALFSLAHLPNPILTLITVFWGMIACMLFLRYRSLYALAVSHAILGIAVAASIPGPVIHNMRVGLGYLTYSPHLHASAQPHRPHRVDAGVGNR